MEDDRSYLNALWSSPLKEELLFSFDEDKVSAGIRQAIMLRTLVRIPEQIVHRGTPTEEAVQARDLFEECKNRISEFGLMNSAFGIVPTVRAITEFSAMTEPLHWSYVAGLLSDYRKDATAEMYRTGYGGKAFLYDAAVIEPYQMPGPTAAEKIIMRERGETELTDDISAAAIELEQLATDPMKDLAKSIEARARLCGMGSRIHLQTVHEVSEIPDSDGPPAVSEQKHGGGAADS